MDTSGAALDAALACPSICLKVKGDEIGGSLGFEVKHMPSAQRALEILVERGLAASCLTQGASGALLATKAARWHAQGPDVQVVSTVGSRDSFLGGLAIALDGGRDGGWGGSPARRSSRRDCQYAFGR